MRDIIIVAGHTNVQGLDQGASANGFIEGQLTVELRDLIMSELSKLGIKARTDSNRNALAQTLQWLKANLFSNKTICVDIHWNAAASREANGSEIIIPNVSSQFERDLANALLKVFTDIGLRKRGIKSEALTARKTLAWMRPNAENVLIEVCFITNPTDMKLYEANKLAISRRIAAVLNHFSKI